MRSKNTSKYHGVTFNENSKKWEARIHPENMKLWETEEEAHIIASLYEFYVEGLGHTLEEAHVFIQALIEKVKAERLYYYGKELSRKK